MNAYNEVLEKELLLRINSEIFKQRCPLKNVILLVELLYFDSKNTDSVNGVLNLSRTNNLNSQMSLLKLVICNNF